MAGFSVTPSLQDSVVGCSHPMGVLCSSTQRLAHLLSTHISFVLPSCQPCNYIQMLNIAVVCDPVHVWLVITHTCICI